MLLVLVSACGGPESWLERGARAVLGGDPTDGHPAVGRLTRDGDEEYVCTGTLVGTRYVLTAEHCAVSGDLSVELEGTAYPVVSKTRFPYGAWGQSYVWGDVAVLRLESAPPLEPLTLNSDPEAVHPGLELTLVGYGEGGSSGPDGVKREGSNKVDALDFHQLKFRDEDGHGLGGGDSGGPSLASSGEQVGVNVSSSHGGGENQAIRTDFHAEWIRRVTCGDASFDGQPPESPEGCAAGCGDRTCGDGETVDTCLADCAKKDDIPPELTILLEDGAEVDSELVVPLEIRDNGVIETVELEVDGVHEQILDRERFDRIPLELHAGFWAKERTITVVAHDVAGNRGEASVTVKVRGKWDDPGARVEEPISGGCALAGRPAPAGTVPVLILLLAWAFRRRAGR